MSKQQSGGDITKWASKDGQFRRPSSQFRDSISAQAHAKFPAARDRYHLVVSLACPWATRTLIVRKLKGLESILPVSIVHPYMGSKGWSFNGEGYEGQGAPDQSQGHIDNVTGDAIMGANLLRELYFKAQPEYDGRFTVPLIWDKHTNAIVSNESAEIIRFMYTEFDALLDDKHKGVTFYPNHLRSEIDDINEWVYDTVNNGVYKCGFATSQESYLENVQALFKSLDRLEHLLEGKDYLVNNELTEADIRLFPTIIRFDPVYVGHFKCNLGTIRHNFPNLNRWMKNLYWKQDAFKQSTDFTHIKVHYYTSHPQINPTRIVPQGPTPDIESL